MIFKRLYGSDLATLAILAILAPLSTLAFHSGPEVFLPPPACISVSGSDTFLGLGFLSAPSPAPQYDLYSPSLTFSQILTQFCVTVKHPHSKILLDKNLSKRSSVHCWCNLVAVRAASFDDKKFLIFQGGQWFVDQLWERWNQ